MDKKEIICHDIALATAKAKAESNLPEYINGSGSNGYALDMLKTYLEIYPLLLNEYDKLTD